MNSVEKNLDIYKIIIVEKDYNIPLLLDKTISSSKYSLSKYINLQEANTQIKTADILILDISNISKIELSILKSIRKENPDLYIILIINTEECIITLRELKELSVQGYCEKDDKLNQLPLFVETAIKSIEQMKMIKTIN